MPPEGDQQAQTANEDVKTGLKEAKRNKHLLRYPPKQTVHARFAGLMQALQHPEKGIFNSCEPAECDNAAMFESCVGCQDTPTKFLIELPKLLRWLQDNWGFGDMNETSHFVKCACHMGYLYPCSFDWNVSTLRCNGSDSLKFGIQIPSYWPLSSIIPHDVDYAIHLLSRSAGYNEPPLDEYEQAVLAKLERNHYSQWSFLAKMCESEKSLYSDCCDHDRKIRQWQDFAYWKMNHPRYLSSDTRGLNRANISDAVPKVAVINEDSSETKARKSQTSCARIAKLCNDWASFDPMITTTPSYNPWTEECDIWPTREDESIPTVYQAKQWGVSFDLLIQDELGQEFFDEHLQKEYSVENLDFYMDCLELKHASLSNVEELIQNIFDNYIAKDCPTPINIDTKTMSIVRKELKQARCRYTFEAAMDHIYNLMKKDSYRRFLQSSIYKGAMKSATDPVVIEAKRKGAFRKKTMMLKFWTT